MDGARGTAAVESDGMNTNATARLSPSASLGLGRIHDRDVLRTTALGVLDARATRLARRGLLASGSIGHPVVEVEITIEFDGNLESVDRESGDLRGRSAAKAGGAGNVRRGNTSDTLGRGALGAERIGTGKATEIETAIVLEGTDIQGTPIKAGRLLGSTIVISVGGALERRGIRPTLSVSVSSGRERGGLFVLTVADTPDARATTVASVVFIVKIYITERRCKRPMQTTVTIRDSECSECLKKKEMDEDRESE